MDEGEAGELVGEAGLGSAAGVDMVILFSTSTDMDVTRDDDDDDDGGGGASPHDKKRRV